MNVMWTDIDGTGLSTSLWSRFAPPNGGVFQATASGNPARGLFDDFLAFGICSPLTSNVAYYQSNGITYKSFEDDAGITAAVPSTTPAVDANGPGVIALTAGNTDNDDVILQAGAGTMMPFNVIPGMGKDLVFECRFKYSSIAGGTDFFLGLGGTGAAANNGVRADDSGVLASNNLLGFTRLATGTSGLTFTYQRVGGTEATHTGMATLVADKYLKAGFRYSDANRNCTVWINGVQVHEVTKAECAATPWPSLWMNLIAAVKYQSTAQDVMYLDWWACAQAL